ncbi:MAG: SMC-Scp complex subunit ScpB [Methylocystis sp.]|jgi:segregation and condensation protein B|nr:SMC-Scp complex subunit ScpB [Methylocystis sp.]MCA3583704.1 SMC-Scp complex subunit ScpB [Methylocystis sp.]MCA3587716.1 SMC-Scp complex subunit ScpB [Methylocystis sp.]MCA3590022.1 SMC-Scp complex subunit ScpB [Methylocystis sp.]
MARERAASAKQSPLFDRELADLPPEARWREWMGRVEAAIFASRGVLPRDALAALVGRDCVLDDLIADIRDELRRRPYDLVAVGGGWQHRTRRRFSDAVRQAGARSDQGEAPGLSPTETLAVTAIAYLQPVTRAQLSAALGREISRDTIALLKQAGLVGAGPRVAQPGAPLTYVTTPAFLSLFGLASLRDLPDIDAPETPDLEGATGSGGPKAALDIPAVLAAGEDEAT